MHPNKAEALAKLAESSRELDAEIARVRDMACNPRRDGWTHSLKAAVTLPVLGAGAILVDAIALLFRGTDDRKWG